MREFTIAMARDLVGRDDGLILEIGANEADDTVKFLTRFPAAHIHGFECDQRAIAKWHRNVAASGHGQRATLHEFALADAVGVKSFYPSSGTPPGKCWEGYGDQWDKSGSLLPPDRHCDNSPWMEFLPPTSVPCRTLDDWAADYSGEFQFAWVDVQGAEAAVIRGGLETVRRIRWWYCECDPRPNYHGQADILEIRNLLEPLGFRYVEEFGGYNHLFQNTLLR